MHAAFGGWYEFDPLWVEEAAGRGVLSSWALTMVSFHNVKRKWCFSWWDLVCGFCPGHEFGMTSSPEQILAELVTLSFSADTSDPAHLTPALGLLDSFIWFQPSAIMPVCLRHFKVISLQVMCLKQRKIGAAF